MRIRQSYLFVLLALLSTVPKSAAQFIEKEECQVFFDSDIDELNGDAQKVIRKSILALSNQTIKEIYINGHADSDASDEYNIDLSARRAENTKRYLQSLGVKSRMIKLHAFGESKPMSDLKRENRRVDVVFVYELFNTPEMKKGRKVIQGYVYHAVTKKRLPSSFVMELQGKNDYKKTNKKAYFRLYVNGMHDVNLVFAKTGFWTESIDLPSVKIANVSDTLTLHIYLKPIRVKEKFTFDNIYFYTDSHILKPDSKKDLDRLLEFMKKEKDARIEIQGHMNFPKNRHASPIQTLYNRTLSHNRAKAVYSHLVKNGIDPKRMTYKGLSNFRMVYPLPKTREEEDANKRVEAWVLEIEGET